MLHIEQSHVLNPQPLALLSNVRELNLKDNYIGDFTQVAMVLQAMKQTLKVLDLRQNPIQKVPKYRDHIVVLT